MTTTPETKTTADRSSPASRARQRVSADELKEKWFSSESTGMTHDHQTEEVVVHMSDGQSFTCSFAEHSAALKAARS